MSWFLFLVYSFCLFGVEENESQVPHNRQGPPGAARVGGIGIQTERWRVSKSYVEGVGLLGATPMASTVLRRFYSLRAASLYHPIVGSGTQFRTRCVSVI